MNSIKLLKPDLLVEKLNEFNFDASTSRNLLGINLDSNVEQILNETPNLNKQQIIEILIQENPQHKDLFLENISRSVDRQILEIESKLNAEQTLIFHKALKKEDLK